MNNLETVLNHMQAMLDDYHQRMAEAGERITTLGNSIQQEQAGMAAAAEDDNMEAYREHEARLRFLTARLEAAKREHEERLFPSRTEAEEISREHLAAVFAEIKPILSRLQETIDAQKAIINELREVSRRSGAVVGKVSRYALDAGCYMSTWTVDIDIIQRLDAAHRKAESYIRNNMEWGRRYEAD